MRTNIQNYLDKFSLQNKTAYVTGGLGLIGREISIALATAGAKTIILDIKDEVQGEELTKEINNEGYTAYYEKFDITDLENLESAIDNLSEKYDTPDIWVNDAYPRTDDWGNKVEDLNLESWRKNVDMHMNSYSWTSRKVCLLMRKNGGGSLINLGSTYGLQGNDFMVYERTEMTSPMAYAAIKGGIINLTRYLASYFGKDNIRVNNICPGGIFDHQNPTFVENYSKKTPLKRMGSPEDIAAGVVYLASNAAAYVTGHSLVVDGGWTIV